MTVGKLSDRQQRLYANSLLRRRRQTVCRPSKETSLVKSHSATPHNDVSRRAICRNSEMNRGEAETDRAVVRHQLNAQSSERLVLCSLAAFPLMTDRSERKSVKTARVLAVDNEVYWRQRPVLDQPTAGQHTTETTH